MLKSYLKITFRNLYKQKLFSLVKLGGLAVGIASCLLIALYLQHELGYDRFLAEANRTYRIVETIDTDGAEERSASVPIPLATAIRTEFPEVEVTRIFSRSAWGSTPVRYNDQIHNETGYFEVDSTFFNVFSLPFVYGSRESALRAPGAVVLTQSTARKYFGDRNPLGERLHVEEMRSRELTVTGVIEDPPSNSHIQFDLLERNRFGPGLTNWSWNATWTYVMFPPHYRDASAFEGQLRGLVEKYFPPSFRDKVRLDIQPVPDIHLNSDLHNELSATTNKTYLYILAAIATIILLLASINYMNLATAQSARRASEVGMRRTVGASRRQLIGQFMGESFVIGLLAVVAGTILTVLLRPLVGSFFGTDLPAIQFLNPNLWYVLGGIFLVIGLGSGLYPAFVLSSFKPIDALKGSAAGRGRSRLWESLVVFQFGATVILIIGTGVVYSQMEYIQQSNLGLNEEQTVAMNVPMQFRRAENETLPHDAIREALLQEANIREVTILDQIPWRGQLISRLVRPAGAVDQLAHQIPLLWSDEYFAEVFGAKILAGSNLNRGPIPESMNDLEYEVILNRKAARQFGWSPDDAVGRRLDLRMGQTAEGEDNWLPGTVAGVISDFHFETLHHEIAPLVVVSNPYRGHAYKVIELSNSATAETIHRIEAVWDRFVPEWPLELIFMDDDYARQYRTDLMFERLFRAFAVLAIIIACMGLFGLSAHMAEWRRKEVGIRKALGATIPGLVGLLSKEFIRLVIVSFLIGAPVAYVLMSSWLDSFAYHTTIGPMVFILSGLLVLLIAQLTVGTQAVKAGLVNPVESLRAE